MFILLHNSNSFSIFAVSKSPESGIKLSPLHRSRAIFIPARYIIESNHWILAPLCVSCNGAQITLGGF